MDITPAKLKLSKKNSILTRSSEVETKPKDKFSKFEQVKPEEIGVKFSKDKLILSGPYTPDRYTVSVIKDNSVDLQIIPKNCEGINLSTGTIMLNRKNKSQEVIVYSDRNENSEVELFHVNHENNKCFVLKVYVLGSQGIELRTTGSDEHYQLAHSFSTSRFISQLQAALEEKEYTAQRTQVLRPTPEIVNDNMDLLILKDNDECYVEFPYWVGLSSGELHGLACTNDGRLYSWGCGIFGQLGLNKEVFEKEQNSLLASSWKKIWSKRLKPISMLQSHPGNLREYLDEKTVPFCPVTTKLQKVNISISVESVSCGLFHSLVLGEGKAFSFGLGEAGRLGLGSQKSFFSPQPISLPNDCIKITAGYHTSFFLLKSREVYSCGEYSSGAVGHSDTVLSPSKIVFLSNIHHISSALSHTAAVDTNGHAILFGSNADNKLGGTSPHTIQSIGGEIIRKVYCGGRHTVALTDSLEVYAWGQNSLGQLGLSSTMFHSMKDPVRVEYLSGRGVTDLSLGYEHSSAITADGLLYCWGSNSKGQLVIGTLAKEFRRVGLPRLIDHLLGNPVTCIATGRHTTFFATAEPNPDQMTSMFAHWKRCLLVEEKHMQELANYRFSLLIRDLKRNQLVQQILEEREKELCRPLKTSKTEQEYSRFNISPSKLTCYYDFWSEKNEEVYFENRTVVKFIEPNYCKNPRITSVTMFEKPKKPKPENKIDLTNFMAVASEEGSRLEENRDPKSHYQRLINSEREYKHLPSLLYPNLFYPYDLVPNPLLLAPKYTS